MAPKWLLRAEGAGILLMSVVFYAARGYSWWLFAVLFLAPDLCMLAYLHSVSLGAKVYNVVHTEILPILLGLAGLLYVRGVLPYALIWLAHIGFDRMLGFGLKYPTRFNDTHLARV
jgi:hypothetical protein